jgi:hypothetical protein
MFIAKNLNANEINARNHEFWEKQKILLELRMQDDAIRELAFANLQG